MTKTPSANSLDTNYQEVTGQTDQLLSVVSSGNIHPTWEHQNLIYHIPLQWMHLRGSKSDSAPS